MKVLFFTDSHVTPDEDLSRFTALGNLILSEQPDVVVQGGDFVTLDTFSRWDKDKRLKIEGKRYYKDIAAGNEAIENLIAPVIEHNKQRRKNKEKQYLPQWMWIQGNHSYWADEYVMRNPELEGVIDIKKDLRLDRLPGSVDYVPYRAHDWSRELEGVHFCHIPRNRVGPISGKYIADKALEVFNASVVFGHSHRLVSSSVRRSGSERVLRAVSGGCFFAKDPDYSVGNCNDYWRGVLLINVKDGELSYREIPLQEML